MSVSELQHAYNAMFVYGRAIGCAHFSGAETSVINHIFEVAWFRPRLIYGQRKAVPAIVKPTRHGHLSGYDHGTISRAIANLRDGNVILDRDGGYVPNPEWRDWLDNHSGERAINPACYHYVAFGGDQSQVLHDCEVAASRAPTHTTDVVDGAPAHGDGRNDGETSPQVANSEGFRSNGVSLHTTDVMDGAPAHGTPVAIKEPASRRYDPQSELSGPGYSWRSEKVSEEIYLSKPIDQQREATSADDRMQSSTVGHSGAHSENNDIYIYPDNASQSPIGPETNQASADPSPIITANPAPTIPADTAEGSPTTPATASPTSRTVESSTEAHEDYSGANSSTPGHTRSEPAPPAATIANNQATYQAAMPIRTAVEYTMAGELPGPFTVDPDQWRAFVALTDQYMPMREIASKLHLYRRQFPTAWFVKIAKRCVLTKDKKSITHGYMLSILRAWGRNGDGPDTGPEEEYRDDLTMIAVPFVPFTSTIMGNSAGVELDAYGEPSRFAPEVKAKFMEMMNERLRRYAT